MDSKRPGSLSRIPSKAIRQALGDLALCVIDPDYQINFDVWHEPGKYPDYTSQFLDVPENDDVVCTVCFAGSVMAKTFKKNPESQLNSRSFGPEAEKMFEALNKFRMGEISNGLWRLGISVEPLPKDFPMHWDVDETNYKQFVTDMNEIADILEENNL